MLLRLYIRKYYSDNNNTLTKNLEDMRYSFEYCSSLEYINTAIAGNIIHALRFEAVDNDFEIIIEEHYPYNEWAIDYPEIFDYKSKHNYLFCCNFNKLVRLVYNRFMIERG